MRLGIASSIARAFLVLLGSLEDEIVSNHPTVFVPERGAIIAYRNLAKNETRAVDGDTESTLPALYWYVSGTPELMEAVAARLEKRWEVSSMKDAELAAAMVPEGQRGDALLDAMLLAVPR